MPTCRYTKSQLAGAALVMVGVVAAAVPPAVLMQYVPMPGAAAAAGAGAAAAAVELKYVLSEFPSVLGQEHVPPSRGRFLPVVGGQGLRWSRTVVIVGFKAPGSHGHMWISGTAVYERVHGIPDLDYPPSPAHAVSVVGRSLPVCLAAQWPAAARPFSALPLYRRGWRSCYRR